jgi:hypothetical protein
MPSPALTSGLDYRIGIHHLVTGEGNFMILKSKRATVAALSMMAIMLTVSIFAAGSASAAQSAKVIVAPPGIARHNCEPIVILDRAPC